MRGGMHALNVVFGKVTRGRTRGGCRPSVGSSGSIFCHHPAQPIEFRSVTSVLGSGWIAWHYRTSLCSGIERGNLSARFRVLYQIDKLSDQSASDEERQQRKRRLCGAVAVDDLAKPSSRASSRPDSTTAEPPRRADYHQRAGIVEIQVKSLGKT